MCKIFLGEGAAVRLWSSHSWETCESGSVLHSEVDKLLKFLPILFSIGRYAKMTSLLRMYFTPIVTGLPSCSKQSSPCLCSSARPASGHTLATILPFFPAQQRHFCSCCAMPSQAVH